MASRAANISKMCRICCDRSINNLIFLLDSENKTIVKKLRACADITIEQDDLLPKYICTACFENLNTAYMFKIQCEFMDDKLRKSIRNGLQKHATLRIISKIRNDDLSWESNSSDDGVTASSDGISMHTTMEDLQSISPYNNNYQRSDQTSSDPCDGQIYTQFNPFNRMIQNTDAPQPLPPLRPPPSLPSLSQDNCDENAMDVSPPKVFDVVPLQIAKSADECVDQEMHSVKSDTESLPTMNRLLSCETCGANFLTHAEYNKHIKGHGKYRYQCSVCSRWFEQRYQLNLHRKTHSGAKPFECSLCKKRYTSQTNLDRHVRVIHKMERQHICTTCQKTFTQLASLRLHQSVHEAERQFGCDICNHKFKSEIHLKLHKKRHLPTEYRVKRKYSPPKKPYKKSPPKLCVCNECGKRFTSVALLRSHMQSHSQFKKYECKYCKKRFSFQQTLRNHIFLHTGEKRFKCDICNIAFRQIGHLQGHKLVHSGIKPHSCMECGKLFALRGNLTVHMRTHDGSKPYHCKICTKGFSDSNSLKRHHLRHQRKSQTNPISSAEQIDEVTTETPTEFSNIEAPTVQSTIMQLPSTAAPMGAKVAQWAMDQNAAFHMSTVEPTFADDSTYQAVSVPLQLNLAPAQTINDANKIIFKAD